MSRLPLVTAFAFLLAAAASLAAPPTTAPANSVGIVVGPDTTVLTSPLLADGTVDYPAAIEAIESQGVTPQNNAVVIFEQIIDAPLSNPADVEKRKKLLQGLGIGDQIPNEVTWIRGQGLEHSLPAGNRDNPVFVSPEGSFNVKPWAAADIPELAAYLKANEKALEIAATASRRPRFWMPLQIDSHPEGSVIGSGDEFKLWRKAHDALLLRAMLKLGQGDSSGALDDLLVLERLASLEGQSPEMLFPKVGAICRKRGCLGLWRVLQDSKLSADQLRRLSADLSAIPPIPEPPLQAWQRHRYKFLMDVQMMASGSKDFQKIKAQAEAFGLPIPDWNRILRLGNKYFDDFEQTYSLPPGEPDTIAALKAFQDRVAQIVKIADESGYDEASNKWAFPRAGDTRDTYSDRIGSILLAMLMLSPGDGDRPIRQANAQLDWTAKVGVAMALFRLDHGKYPETLDELIPKYLDQLARNPSHNPVEYERRRAGYVIRNAADNSTAINSATTRQSDNIPSDELLIRTDEVP